MKNIWKRFNDFNFFDTTSRTVVLTGLCPSVDLIEQVKNGQTILVKKICSNSYALAFTDKDDDYKEVSIWDLQIINALNQYSQPSGNNFMLLKGNNNNESALLFKNINALLKTDQGKYLITDNSNYAGVLSIVNLFAKVIIFITLFIFIPVIVGIKTLIDWSTRKPCSYDKIELAVANINALNENQLKAFSESVEEGYKQSYTTSTSSQKMITQMKRQIKGVNSSQLEDKENIINYINDTHNNGKRLFRNVIKAAVDDIDYINSAPEREQKRIHEQQRQNLYENQCSNMMNDELSAALSTRFSLLKKVSQKLFLTRAEVSHCSEVRSDVECLLRHHKIRGIKAPSGLYINQGKIVEPDNDNGTQLYGLATGNFY